MQLAKALIEPSSARILMIVADGLGGLPNETGKTELESAQRPNLDALARESALGLTDPIGHGITPGSGPAHLALFGYDPIASQVGRGVLEALGIGLDLTGKDLCIRANFATIDHATRLVTDRRAGRIPTEKNLELTERIRAQVRTIEDVDIIVRSGVGYRVVVVLRGEALSDRLTESDPQAVGREPRPIRPEIYSAEKSARIVNEFLNIALKTIRDEPDANYLLLRGFSKLPTLEPMRDRYGLEPACVASYPAYRGLAMVLGMKVLPTEAAWEKQVEVVAQNLKRYTFFYLHFKEIDRMGEDGDFEGKVRCIEELDALIPRIMELGFDVIVLTGDHSTPAVLRAHSWHPNPFLIWSRYVRSDGIAEFTERACARGSIGRIEATQVMPLVLANALKLKKFGA